MPTPCPSCSPLRLRRLLANVRVALRANVSGLVFDTETPFAMSTADNHDFLVELAAEQAQLFTLDAFTLVKDLLQLLYPRSAFAIAFVVSMVLERCVFWWFDL